MDYQLPHHIRNERDLQIYEDYLHKDSKESAHSSTPQNLNTSLIPCEKAKPLQPITVQNGLTAENSFFYSYLKEHRGKLIKVESLIANRLESRIGILIKIGNDYIVLKLPRSNCTLIIKAESIKYVTIVHDNDMSKAY